MKIIREVSIIVLTILLLANCVNHEKKTINPTDANDSLSINRSSILIHLADEIIIPGYTNFKIKLDSMIISSNSFTKNPNPENLVKYRNSWKTAYIEWQKVQLFEFGPAKSNSTISYINIYPTNSQTINSNINSSSVNLEIPSNYAAQGFPAIDYLINGLASTDDSIVNYYVSDKNSNNRIAYLNKLNDQLILKTNQSITDWTSYRSTFINSTGLSVSSSFSLITNGIIESYEKNLKLGKFGSPAGVLTYIKAPEKSEAYYKRDISKILAQTAHQAFIDFFNGKSIKTGKIGMSFKTYLDGLGAKDSQSQTSLSTNINAQFEIINTKISAIGDDFTIIVKSNNEQLIEINSELQKAVRLLKVDMSSAMSISITYIDSDGD